MGLDLTLTLGACVTVDWGKGVPGAAVGWDIEAGS